MLIKELDQLGVNYNVRRLQVGDFLWVAEHVSGSAYSVLVSQFEISWIQNRLKVNVFFQLKVVWFT